MKKLGIILITFIFSFVLGYSQTPESSVDIELEENYGEETENAFPINEIEVETLQTEEEYEAGPEIEWPDYAPWDKAEIQGKLKMKGLPLSPTLKIYLEKDSLIDISIRAPFIGEAARIVVNLDTITAINKMNKTFVREGLNIPGAALNIGSVGINALQNLLLARFFLPGFDLAETDLNEVTDIFFEDNQFNVVPKGEAKIEGITYGFVVDDLFKPLLLVILPENRNDLEFDVVYAYNSKGYDINLYLQNGMDVKEAVLELKNPDWGGARPNSIDLGKKYRQLSLGEFLNSITQ